MRNEFFRFRLDKNGGNTYPQSDYFDTLTAMRGVAAVSTVAFHSDMFLKEIVHPETTMFVKNGWLWVDFFFVLSGFVISYKYDNWFSKEIRTESFVGFIQRRFARVYALHLTTLIITCCLVLVLDSKTIGMSRYITTMLSLDSIPAHLLFVHALHLYDTPTLNTSSWSLSTEWWTYMLFPLLARFVGQLETLGKKIAAVFMVIALYVSLIYIANSDPQELSMTSFHHATSRSLSVTADWGFLRCVAGFFWGMVISKFFRAKNFYILLSKDYVCVIFLLMLAFGLHADINALFAVFLFGVIVLTLSYNRGGVAHILKLHFFQILGKLSFSIYLVHIPVIYLFWIWIAEIRPDALLFPGIISDTITSNGFIVFLILTSITVLVSAITYRFVEQPGRKYLISQ
jgi:peptidoglycan/LPS O-acetylase OafA/YrhL